MVTSIINLHTLKNPIHGSIIDIGGSHIADHISDQLQTAFIAAKLKGERPCLPDELLYDDAGLQLWSEIIYLPGYYQTRDEIAILESNGADIASCIATGATLVDLGAGDTRKAAHLLKVLEARELPVTYLALDISSASLSRNLDSISRQHTFVRCAGLWGTFSDALTYCDSIPSQRIFLSLGSILCNDPWSVAIERLRSWAAIMRSDDLLIVGMDGHRLPRDRNKIWSSYHSGEALFARFWRNGFEHANRLVKEEWFRDDDWSVSGVIEDEPVSHRFVFKALKEVQMGSTGVRFEKGEEMDWFDAHKYGEKDVREMCMAAGLSVQRVWKAPDSEMRQYLLRRNENV